ncbi:hypothetical protein LCS82_07655 [Vibrio harveyi]|uniref:hypothetical protein n=1 Tax=Vibrio harveyi TaxID=669 RepID=UPI003BB6A974
MMKNFKSIELNRSLTGNIEIDANTSITILTKLELARFQQCFDLIDQLNRDVGFYTTGKALVYPVSKHNEVLERLSVARYKFEIEQMKITKDLPNKIKHLLERKPELTQYADDIKLKSEQMIESFKLKGFYSKYFNKNEILNHDIDAMLLDLKEQLKHLMNVTAFRLRKASTDNEKFIDQSHTEADLTLVVLDNLVAKCRDFGHLDSSFLNYGHSLSVLSAELENVDVFNGSNTDRPKLEAIIMEIVELICTLPGAKSTNHLEANSETESEEKSNA